MKRGKKRGRKHRLSEHLSTWIPHGNTEMDAVGGRAPGHRVRVPPPQEGAQQPMSRALRAPRAGPRSGANRTLTASAVSPYRLRMDVTVSCDIWAEPAPEDLPPEAWLTDPHCTCHTCTHIFTNPPPARIAPGPLLFDAQTPSTCLPPTTPTSPTPQAQPLTGTR